MPDRLRENAEAEGPRSAKPAERSYLQIFRSSAIIAGSSMVTLCFSVVRNKSAALWLGPEGIGLIGLFNSIIDLATGLAGGGLAGSGVRQIAEANGSGDAQRIAKTVAVLRWLSLALGICGAALLLIFAGPVANWTFSDPAQTTGVMLIAIAVFLRLLASGQTALLQGLRRIGDLAKANVLSSFLSFVVFVAMIWLFGVKGIVPALIIDAVIILAVCWWYARRITLAPVDMTKGELTKEAGEMLRLGLVFMANGLFVLGAAYAVRIIVTNESGIAAAGLYQAAWALASLYAGFILQAMGVDFYPRLTAVAQDNKECNRLVNEQTHVSILLAGPGLLATLTLAPIAVHIFYSAEFNDAVSILRWFCVGMMMRIIAWPIGFIVLAKNEQRIFFWMELAAAVVHIGLAWLFVRQFGPIGAGMALFGLYIWHTAFVGFIVHRLSGFRWSAENLRLGALYIGATAIVCAGFGYLGDWTALGLGVIVTAICGIHSLYSLLTLVPPERLPSPLKRFLPKSN